MALGIYIGVGLAFCVCAVAVAHVVNRRARHGAKGASLSGGTVPASGKDKARAKDPLEQSKLVIHALLQSVSDSVEGLVDGSVAYNNSLERHKASVRKAMTIAGIKELERVLLDELQSIQSETQRYRKELDEANEKLKEQQERMQQLESDVAIDFLTKIPNRRGFDARFQEEMDRARRYKNNLSLIVLDVDDFKLVNDRYGHLAGDRVLRALAHMFGEEKRSTDYLARYGGEEFVIILPETEAENARVLAEKVRMTVQAARFRFDKHSISVTLSIGVGQADPVSDTVKTLFERTDAAMFRAKEKGRNRVELAGPAAPRNHQ